MLPQVASGTIETRHIVIPVRTVLKRSQFYEAEVKNIDPYGKTVTLGGTKEKRGIRKLRTSGNFKRHHFKF